MKTELHLDSTRFRAALKAFLATSKKTLPQVLTEQARGFVRRAIGFTPPSTGKANSAAKKTGEGAVHADLARIFTALDPAEWSGFFNDEGRLQIVPTYRENKRGASVTDLSIFLKRNDMEAFHEKLRSKTTGRARRVVRDNLIGRKKSDVSEMGLVTKQNFAWFERKTKKRVGLLAGGWNAAADKLGYRPPAWIRRHGTGRGQITVKLTGEHLRITITNAVPFGSHVKGLERQVQTALDSQSAALERQTKNFLEKVAKRSGFK
jgi:hypothetical protein